MAHSFVLAKFNPTLTATKAWMSPTVFQAANSLVCRPFVALAIALTESHPGQQFGYNVVLFPVSPRMPSGEFAEYYATVSIPPTKETWSLSIGLPSQPSKYPMDILYVHTVPALYLKSGLPTCALSYQLDPDSLQQLRTLGQSHQITWLQSVFQRLNSGGDDSVQEKWDTWSGNPYQERVPYGSYMVDYLNQNGIDLGNIAPSHILEELMMFKKLAWDYSGRRVENLITWCLGSRKRLLAFDPNSCCANLELDGETTKLAIELYRMRIPVDRQPMLDDTTFDELESNVDPDPITHSGFSHPPVSCSDIRIVLFDSIGLFFDRQTSVLRALHMLDPQKGDKHEPEDVLKVYFEAESNLLQDNPEWDFYRVVKSALKDTMNRLRVGMSSQYDPVLLNGACEAVFQLGLYPGVERTIDELSSQGITAVGLSVPGASSFILPSAHESFVFDSFSQDASALLRTSSDLFSTLLERLQAIRDDVKGKEQVLVASTGRFRVLEPACFAGYPTALIQHNVESKVELYPICLPTVLVPGGLSGLKEKLTTLQVPGIPATKNDAESDVVVVHAGLYRGVEMLGNGSFGEVHGGVHVLTGTAVAIKHDFPEHSIESHVCETNPYPCSLPYEAQVYKVLAGGTGFPSFRWFGVREGAHVLVLDKLGPDLDAVRLLCRGHLSLKTVLILGLQMLERVEFVHSRGLILRDLKPQNFVMGLDERSSMVYLLDFGLVRPYVNPITNEHIPFTDNLERVGTARYSSYNMLLKRETSRRDDIEALGNVLLFLLRGRLPWQGIYAASVEAKYVRLAEMRVSRAMQDFINESPGRDLWNAYFKHCRELAFVDKPNYNFLREVMSRQLQECSGAADGRLDWMGGTGLKYGTLVPGEYKLDASLFHDNFSMKELIPLDCQWPG